MSDPAQSAEPQQPAFDPNAFAQQLSAHLAQQVRAQVAPIQQQVAQIAQIATQPRQAPAPTPQQLGINPDERLLREVLENPTKPFAEAIQLAADAGYRRAVQFYETKEQERQANEQWAQFRSWVVGNNPDVADVEAFVWQEGWNYSQQPDPYQRAAEAVNYARQKKAAIAQQAKAAEEAEAARKRQMASPVGNQLGPFNTSSVTPQDIAARNDDQMAYLHSLQATQSAMKDAARAAR